MLISGKMVLSAGAVLAAFGVACGISLFGIASPNGVVIGSKMFTENRILCEIMAQAIEAKGVAVERREFGSTTLVYESLIAGAIDLYPEYTGTLLVLVFKQEPITQAAESLRKTRELLAEQTDLEALAPFGLNDTYVLAMKHDLARAKQITKISDLRSHPDLITGFFGEFVTRQDGFAGMAKHYDLHFSRTPIELNPTLMYQAVDENQVELVSALSTDGRNRKYGLLVLEDDRGFFPVYNALPLVRTAVLNKYPQVAEALAPLADQIDDELMAQLN
jgi:glycine betaine/choline ABC-type transport system substrate-binding protein